jgi:hypothetical protein
MKTTTQDAAIVVVQRPRWRVPTRRACLRRQSAGTETSAAARTTTRSLLLDIGAALTPKTTTCVRDALLTDTTIHMMVVTCVHADLDIHTTTHRPLATDATLPHERRAVVAIREIERRVVVVIRETASADTGLVATTMLKRSLMFRPWGLVAHIATETTIATRTTAATDLSTTASDMETAAETSVATGLMAESRDGSVNGERRRSVSVNARRIEIETGRVHGAMKMITTTAMMTGGGHLGVRERKVLEEVYCPTWSLRKSWRRVRKVGNKWSLSLDRY